MPTRQDQLHSYQFMIQRVVAALVMHETDPPQAPFRRIAGATLAGVMVAALALAATAVYGVLKPGDEAGWRDGGAVIVERESGARYVLRDGRLHPVANYASALLILGAPEPATMLVGRAALLGVPRGVPLGIPDAPDSLPAAGSLVGTPWTVCSRRGGPVLFVGPREVGGRPLGEVGVLAGRADAAVYLIWRNRRHLVREPGVVLPALGWGAEPVAPVAAAVLDVIPAGDDLGRIAIPGRGRPSRVPRARVGEVFTISSQGGGRQYAVAVRDGLAGITQVQADLLIGDPLTGQRAPRVLAAGEYAALPKVGALVPASAQAPPASSPSLIRPDGDVCAVVGGEVDLLVDVAVPDAGRVVVPPEGSAVVESGRSGGLWLVTDLGLRYALPGPDVLTVLGLGGVRPVRLPPAVLALVPAGPVLDPEAARSPVIG